jgi:hypothetical protein
VYARDDTVTIPTHARACAPQAFESQASTIFSKKEVSKQLVMAFQMSILQESSRCACTRVHRERQREKRERGAGGAGGMERER